MKAKVAVFGILRFPPENIHGVLPHLQDLVRATYESDGCIAYDVAEDPFEKGLIRFSELWPDRDSLNNHLLAPHVQSWREQAKKYGLTGRQFNSYDITSDAFPI